MVGVSVKEFIHLFHKVCPSHIPLVEFFFSIFTIVNVLDLDGEHHTRVWPTHLYFHTKRNNVPFELPSQWDPSYHIWSHPHTEGIGHAKSDRAKN
jgi:hypothetical protein